MSRYTYYCKPAAPQCEICNQPSCKLAMCIGFQCGRMVCPECSAGATYRDLTYYKETLCKSCVERRAKEEEERQAEADALEARQKVFKEKMVRIEISSLCRQSNPCCHGVTAYDSENQSCDMGDMNARAIRQLMNKLGQTPNPHIEHVLNTYDSYRSKNRKDAAVSEHKERCKEWGFQDM